MDNAQVYLSLVRPTMIPIVGESAAALPFTGQVELAGWSWNMLNLEEARRAKNLAKPYSEKASQIGAKEDARASGKLQQDLAKMTAAHKKEAASEKLDKLMGQKKPLSDAAQGEFDTALKSYLSADKERDDSLQDLQKELSKTLNPEREKERESAKEADRRKKREALEGEIEDANENKNYQFTFSKRVDIATTQMLNSMKSGDVFPTGVLTIHQSSANAGLSLVITVQKLRLIDYQLKVEVSDTMTDMREEWTAEFASLAYVYKNRKAISKSSEASQAVAKAASQGTVRAFAMKNLGSPI